jgi:hypothetical protein
MTREPEIDSEGDLSELILQAEPDVLPPAQEDRHVSNWIPR